MGKRGCSINCKPASCPETDDSSPSLEGDTYRAEFVRDLGLLRTCTIALYTSISKDANDPELFQLMMW